MTRLDPGGILGSSVGASGALGTIVHASTEVVEPGLVVNVNGGRMLVGDATPGLDHRAQAVAAALNCPGLTVVATDDLPGMWAKLVLGRMADALRRETLAVAAAQGYPGITLEPGRAASPLPIKPLMLQDLERRRPMEIQTQLAIVQDLGRAAGVATPMLDTLLPLLVLRARVAGCLPPGIDIGETAPWAASHAATPSPTCARRSCVACRSPVASASCSRSRARWWCAGRRKDRLPALLQTPATAGMLNATRSAPPGCPTEASGIFMRVHPQHPAFGCWRGNDSFHPQP